LIDTLKTLSSKFHFGLERFRDRDCSYCLGTNLNYGLGLAYNHSGIKYFALYNAHLDYSGRIKSNLRLKYGPEMGAIYRYQEWFGRLGLNMYSMTGSHSNHFTSMQLLTQWNFYRNESIKLEINQFSEDIESIIGYARHF
jgi:hypothetical protein